MKLFGKKKEEVVNGLIGVDIGYAGIKVVELLPAKGRVKLGSYGYSEMEDPSAEHISLIDDTKRGAAVLAKLIKDAGIKSKRANAALPSQSVFHAIITVPKPKTAKEDLKPLIEARVQKLLPMPLEEMILDSTIIDKDQMPTSGPALEMKADAKKARKHIRVLVSGAPKELVGKYVELFKMAKVELTSLETESFGLIRSLVGKDKARMMIVDIGSNRTSITVVHEGIPFLHRSIKAGGSIVTDMMSKQMGISLKEAEQAKRDLSLGNDSADLPPALREAMMPILHEIKYALDLFAAQEFHVHSSVEKIIITGGSAHLPQIDKFLTKALNINVYLGDPWARVASPAGIRPILDEIGPRFSVAVGLAMKDSENK